MTAVLWLFKRTLCALLDHKWAVTWHSADSIEREGLNCVRCRHVGLRYVGRSRRQPLLHNVQRRDEP